MHPLRAELEIKYYGRSYFQWLSEQPNIRSIPFLLFIDDFGVHRNMYKALKAFYLTPAGLTYRERRYLDNSFTLTLGPYGAKMEDSIQVFKKEIWTLSQGIYVYLYGVRTVITASIIVFTGDMP
ncbi:hypothetical protein BO71DRAFT_142846 [Aspergillus ellipticus CBS 707.79]|uniref:Uncharacterized protein n=1 Tax=Aspergillus ellipticus CBS 707.79 TaxID=1448320 RepID=A0A319E944_9EURO|nr:hypothetical protein BO71DRAFT_142846 [Aspergillus ellipticus CBS 707.79]